MYSGAVGIFAPTAPMFSVPLSIGVLGAKKEMILETSAEYNYSALIDE